MKLDSPYTIKGGRWVDGTRTLKSAYPGLFSTPWLLQTTCAFHAAFLGTVPPPAIIFCLWKGSERSESLDSINTWMHEKCKAMSYLTGLLERGEKKLHLKTPMCMILTWCLKRQEFKLSIWLLKQNRQRDDLSRKIDAIHVTALNGKGKKKRRNREKMRCKGKERQRLSSGVQLTFLEFYIKK